MRPAAFAGLVLLAAPAAGFAQTAPVLAAVTDEVRLRAGPSDQFPETATLRPGDAVVVVREEENGWLAVQDPPGKVHSVSWVQMQLVDFDPGRPTPQNVVVQAETTLAAGQIGLAQPITNVRRAAVPEGTVLTVIGAKVTFEGKSWYPVLPPAGDYRYLPKQAVKYERPATTAFTVRDDRPPGVTPAGASAPGPGAETGGTPGAGPGAGRPQVPHPLWAQAEAAERDGRYDDAEKLYFQLARVMNEPGGDHDVANLCYTRIHTLREKKRAAAGGGVAAADSRPPASAPASPRPQTAVTPRPPAGGTPPAAPADPGDDRPRWTGPGRLKRSALALDGRQTYVLESNSGETLVYVVAAQGVNLERYVNKQVDVYGVSYPRRGLSKPYVLATAAEAAQ
jgi:hypothetical protein